ncbi:MAG: tetratricopeptide repeat protein [Proteobacteria bacterium]|nr:tetratricopeptide repeat protein [Pseudomonadota bacterium]MBU1965831.1 tetratricopeptide repeat protein [Pseudomonadota bacterium]
MEKHNFRIFMVGIAVLILISGCGVSENYKMGQDLMNQNRWDEAIGYFETAVKEDPANTEYKSSLLNARQQAAKIHLEKAKRALSNAPARNLRALDAIVKERDLALNLDPGNPEIRSFNDQLQGKIAALRTEVKALYDKAEADILKEDWLAAVTKLRQVNQIYTGYEDAGSKLARAEQEGAKVLYKQGIELGKQEDWKMAALAFKAATEINPKYLDVARQYEQAKSRDNVDYAVSESIKAEKAQKWDRAILLAEKAADYQPDNRELLARLDSLKVNVAQGYFDDAVKQVNQGRLYDAMRKVELVKSYSPSLQTDPIFKEFIKNFCVKLMERAQKYGENEQWGNALLWYQKVEALSPNYPELFQKLLETRDHINKRIKKSIAVFDFSSPSNNKDAGKIAANKLITYLHKNASGDLRIIERENLQSILREMQLGQTGLVDIKAAQNVGKMRGIDTFIMGDVLHFTARKTDTPSISQVKVLVDEEDVRNPDFSDWLIMHPKPSTAEFKSAPPRTVKKRNYQFISYKQGSAKVNAMLEISYKLVDTSTGENVVTNTVSGKLVREDKYQDGVPVANITHDPLELPTDEEVLDELTNVKVSEMGQSVLKNYQSLEVAYFNEAQQQQKRRNIEQAVEKYIDAIYDEKLKGISTPVSQKSLESIDKLIQDQ